MSWSGTCVGSVESAPTADCGDRLPVAGDVAGGIGVDRRPHLVGIGDAGSAHNTHRAVRQRRVRPRIRRAEELEGSHAPSSTGPSVASSRTQRLLCVGSADDCWSTSPTTSSPWASGDRATITVVRCVRVRSPADLGFGGTIGGHRRAGPAPRARAGRATGRNGLAGTGRLWRSTTTANHAAELFHDADLWVRSRRSKTERELSEPPVVPTRSGAGAGTSSPRRRRMARSPPTNSDDRHVTRVRTWTRQGLELLTGRERHFAECRAHHVTQPEALVRAARSDLAARDGDTGPATFVASSPAAAMR